MAKIVVGSLNLIPVFLFILTRIVFHVRTPWHYRRIYGLDLLTSSVITGMRGATAGVSPPRRSPPRIL